MPLYEYHCDACGREFELIRKFSDPPLEKCPHCGSGPVHKLMSSPAFQFKGTGWYITDYAKKDQSAGSSSDEGKKEGKPEGKAEAAAPASKDAGEKKSTEKTESAEKTDKKPAKSTDG